jgi:predicted TPR repeat methyltransferase
MRSSSTMASARSPDLDAARERALLHPADADAALAHGAVLLAAERLPEAIGELQRALRLDHESVEARRLLGLAWLAAGEPEKALQAFARLDGVDEEVARAEAMRDRSRSDPDYVRHLFDQFSRDYDLRMLETLAYRAPRILRELAELLMPGREGLAILDLGCGTGLAGAAFRDMAVRLDGIDLSPGMVEKARARGVYDRLAVADIEQMPEADGTGYDLLVAADTLIYLGDLSAVFAAARARLEPGGTFLFTVERKEGEGFDLGPKRRWRHSDVYLREASIQAGFDMTGCVACTPRSEAHVPVEGLAVALSRLA